MYQIFGEKCCGQRRPACLTENPTFSWKLKSDGKNITQQQYKITVSCLSGKTVWTSGWVKSKQTHNIPYEGEELKSGADYMWSVESRGSSGERAVGGMALFSMGLLCGQEWKAKWIEPDMQRRPCQDDPDGTKIFKGEMPYLEKPEEILNPSVYFRKEICISKKVKRAKLYATAHGIYEMYVNGTPYGYPLAPGYTVYREYQEYQAYDVTTSLKEGTNVVGSIVSDGWYLGKIGLMGMGNQYGEQLALLWQLDVEYEDGSEEIVGSDGTCMAGTGAYLYADLYVGEGFDAGKTPRGWEEPGYDTSQWKPVIEKDYGYGQLTGSADEPAAIVRVQEPLNIFQTPKGELIVDAGENIAGYIELTGSGKKGVPVKLEYSEVLDKEGNFLRNILGQNKNQTDVYIPEKDGRFSYRPTFTYHGFQYVRLTGIEKGEIEEIKVHVLASDLETAGTFSCSNELINQLQENIFRSQQGNMLYVPTDCPQREKAGWTGDMQVYTPTALYLMDLEAFLRKWLANMRLEQKEDGQVPHVIPDIPSNRCVSHGRKEVCSAAWADACVIIPYRLYMAYGDERILRENYDMMLRWLKYVENKAASEVPENCGELSAESREYQRYLWNTGFHYGDWLIPSLSRDGVAKKPIVGAEMTKELVAPAMFAYTTNLMVEIADILGDRERADYYKALNTKIKEAYTHEYLMADGTLKLNYQGIYVLALQMQLVPEDKREGLLAHLLELIRENGGCLDTGFVSMPFLLDVLYENGKKEEAFRLLYQEKCPSWLYEVKKGANTIWESWNNISEDGEKNKSSYNHFAFGCVGDFIYRRILGIQCLEAGYKKVLIQPDLDCGMSWAKGAYDSIHGEIAVSWSRVGDRAILDVEIPPNVEAQIRFGKTESNTGSGSYHFETALP